MKNKSCGGCGIRGQEGRKRERERASEREEHVMSLLSREWIRRRHGPSEGWAVRRKVGLGPRTESVSVVEQLRAAMNLPPLHCCTRQQARRLSIMWPRRQGAQLVAIHQAHRGDDFISLPPSSSVSSLLLPSHHAPNFLTLSITASTGLPQFLRCCMEPSTYPGCALPSSYDCWGWVQHALSPECRKRPV